MSLLQILKLPAPKNFVPLAAGPATKGAAPAATRATPPGASPPKGPGRSDENAELRAKASALHDAIQSKLEHQSELFKRLVVDAEPKLEQMTKAAATPEAKTAVAAKRALVAKKRGGGGA